MDLAERTVYYTEDSGEGRFYRFVCDADDVVTQGPVPRLRMERGRLQVMEVEGFEADGYIEADADARALRVGRLYAEATPWSERRPPAASEVSS